MTASGMNVFFCAVIVCNTSLLCLVNNHVGIDSALNFIQTFYYIPYFYCENQLDVFNTKWWEIFWEHTENAPYWFGVFFMMFSILTVNLILGYTYHMVTSFCKTGKPFEVSRPKFAQKINIRRNYPVCDKQNTPIVEIELADLEVMTSQEKIRIATEVPLSIEKQVSTAPTLGKSDSTVTGFSKND